MPLVQLFSFLDQGDLGFSSKVFASPFFLLDRKLKKTNLLYLSHFAHYRLLHFVFCMISHDISINVKIETIGIIVQSTLYYIKQCDVIAHPFQVNACRSAGVLQAGES